MMKAIDYRICVVVLVLASITHVYPLTVTTATINGRLDLSSETWQVDYSNTSSDAYIFLQTNLTNELSSIFSNNEGVSVISTDVNNVRESNSQTVIVDFSLQLNTTLDGSSITNLFIDGTTNYTKPGSSSNFTFAFSTQHEIITISSIIESPLDIVSSYVTASETDGFHNIISTQQPNIENTEAIINPLSSNLVNQESTLLISSTTVQNVQSVTQNVVEQQTSFGVPDTSTVQNILQVQDTPSGAIEASSSGTTYSVSSTNILADGETTDGIILHTSTTVEAVTTSSLAVAQEPVSSSSNAVLTEITPTAHMLTSYISVPSVSIQGYSTTVTSTPDLVMRESSSTENGVTEESTIVVSQTSSLKINEQHTTTTGHDFTSSTIVQNILPTSSSSVVTHTSSSVVIPVEYSTQPVEALETTSVVDVISSVVESSSSSIVEVPIITKETSMVEMKSSTETLSTEHLVSDNLMASTSGIATTETIVESLATSSNIQSQTSSILTSTLEPTSSTMEKVLSDVLSSTTSISTDVMVAHESSMDAMTSLLHTPLKEEPISSSSEFIEPHSSSKLDSSSVHQQTSESIQPSSHHMSSSQMVLEEISSSMLPSTSIKLSIDMPEVIPTVQDETTSFFEMPSSTVPSYTASKESTETSSVLIGGEISTIPEQLSSSLQTDMELLLSVTTIIEQARSTELITSTANVLSSDMESSTNLLERSASHTFDIIPTSSMNLVSSKASDTSSVFEFVPSMSTMSSYIGSAMSNMPTPISSNELSMSTKLEPTSYSEIMIQPEMSTHVLSISSETSTENVLMSSEMPSQSMYLASEMSTETLKVSDGRMSSDIESSLEGTSLFGLPQMSESVILYTSEMILPTMTSYSHTGELSTSSLASDVMLSSSDVLPILPELQTSSFESRLSSQILSSEIATVKSGMSSNMLSELDSSSTYIQPLPSLDQSELITTHMVSMSEEFTPEASSAMVVSSESILPIETFLRSSVMDSSLIAPPSDGLPSSRLVSYSDFDTSSVNLLASLEIDSVMPTGTDMLSSQTLNLLPDMTSSSQMVTSFDMIMSSSVMGSSSDSVLDMVSSSDTTAFTESDIQMDTVSSSLPSIEIIMSTSEISSSSPMVVVPSEVDVSSSELVSSSDVFSSVEMVFPSGIISSELNIYSSDIKSQSEMITSSEVEFVYSSDLSSSSEIIESSALALSTEIVSELFSEHTSLGIVYPTEMVSSEMVTFSISEMVPSEVVTSSISEKVSSEMVTSSISEMISTEIVTSSIPVMVPPSEMITSISDIVSSEMVPSSIPVMVPSSDMITSISEISEIVTSPISEMFATEMVTSTIPIMVPPSEMITSISEMVSSEMLTSSIIVMLPSSEMATSSISEMVSSEMATSSISEMISSDMMVTSSIPVMVTPSEMITSISEMVSSEMVTSSIPVMVPSSDMVTSISEMVSSEMITSSISEMVSSEIVTSSIFEMISSDMVTSSIPVMVPPSEMITSISEMVSSEMVTSSISEMVSSEVATSSISEMVSSEVATSSIYEMVTSEMVTSSISEMVTSSIPVMVVSSSIITPSLSEMVSSISEIVSSEMVTSSIPAMVPSSEMVTSSIPVMVPSSEIVTTSIPIMVTSSMSELVSSEMVTTSIPVMTSTLITSSSFSVLSTSMITTSAMIQPSSTELMTASSSIIIPPVTTQPPVINEMDIDGTFKITSGAVWSESLKNASSADYKDLKDNLKMELETMYQNSILKDSFIGIKDEFVFSEGSIVVDYTAIFSDANQVGPANITSEFKSYLDDNNDLLGVYTVNKDTIVHTEKEPVIVTTPAPVIDTATTVLPHWAIAVIVCGAVLLLFLVFMMCVLCSRRHTRQKYRMPEDPDDIGYRRSWASSNSGSGDFTYENKLEISDSLENRKQPLADVSEIALNDSNPGHANGDPNQNKREENKRLKGDHDGPLINGKATLFDIEQDSWETHL